MAMSKDALFAFGHGSPAHGGHPGMTLRDYFAAKAMQALMDAHCAGRYNPAAHPETGAIEPAVARDAYHMADAMLKERGEEPPKTQEI